MKSVNGTEFPNAAFLDLNKYKNNKTTTTYFLTTKNSINKSLIFKEPIIILINYLLIISSTNKIHKLPSRDVLVNINLTVNVE